MLTSSTAQYLHPDYLQPLPTTLDAKKSPLALLAQTCSSIGKDTSPSKTIIPPIEKKDVGKGSPKPGSRDGKKSVSSDEKKDSSRDSHSHKSSSHRSSVPPKEVPPLVPITNSSDEHSRSPPAVSDQRKSRSSSPAVTAVIPQRSSANTPTSSTQSNSRISLSCGNMLLEVNHQQESSSAGGLKTVTSQPNSASSASSLPSSSPYSHSSLPKHPPHPLAYASIAGYPSSLSLPLLGHHGVPIDSLASSQAYHSSLGAHAGLGLPGASALKYGASSVTPYVAYARVRTPAGGSTLVPICRDPYCTNCQLTLQNSHLSSTCTASGCAQCAHEKALTAASYPTASLGLPNGGLPLHPALSSAALAGASNSAYLSSLYPHSMLSAAQGLPYVCNWMSGSDYCGKRFPASEELLQHLRTHTSASDVPTLPSPYSFGLPSASALAACHSHLTAPGSLSPNSLRRGYPLSLSPVSNMLSNSRYHPYKSPLAGVPQVPGAGLAHSSLGAYYSPYTLYGQRLGAAVP